VNKYDFKSLQKLSLLKLESLRLSGNEFQTDGPATEKARRPYVRNQCRGRTRSCRLADLRCCREATSETGRQRSTKYCGAWPCRQLCTMMRSLYMTCSGTLSQCSSVCSTCNSPRSNLNSSIGRSYGPQLKPWHCLLAKHLTLAVCESLNLRPCMLLTTSWVVVIVVVVTGQCLSGRSAPALVQFVSLQISVCRCMCCVISLCSFFSELLVLFLAGPIWW